MTITNQYTDNEAIIRANTSKAQLSPLINQAESNIKSNFFFYGSDYTHL